LKSVQLITDGACKGNPGRGGWACILRFGELKRELFGCSPYTTNNRMELAGAIEGLKRLKESCAVEIITDSEYLRNGITSWINGWKKNGWKTASKKPVVNKDLWLMLDQLVNAHKVVWTWTKGHASHEDNNRCDELASEAALKQLNSEPDSQNDLYRKQDSE
jgi:ribonuclease HI